MPLRAHRRKTESFSELENSSEHIEQVVREKPQRRSSAMMLQLVIPPPPPPEDPDSYLTPTIKKKKSKKKLKNKNKSDVDDSEHGTPGDTGSTKDSKKKKRTKKLRYDSAALGVIIIPDCDDGCVVDYDKDIDKTGGSAHFSTYTEQTSVMGDDDFTEATDEKKLERIPKKKVRCSKSPKRDKKKAECSRSPKRDKKKAECSRSPKRDKKKAERRKSRRCSAKPKSKKDGGENVNQKWGADPNSDKTYMAPELLNLLMDPAMQVGDSDAEKPRSRSKSRSRPGGLKKSNSFNGRKKSSRMSSARRSSVGCSLDIAGIEKLTKTRRHSKSRRKQKDPSASKNATWGSSEPATTSYSPELLNLYSAKKKEPSPMLTRNVKSFGVMRRSSLSGENENDIPSILFLSPENSVNTNDSWSLHSKQSTGKQRKGSGMAAYDSMEEDEDDEVNDITRQSITLPFQRRKSTDSNYSRGSSGSRGIGKSVSMMMQNSGISQGRRHSSCIKRNDLWGGDRGPVSNKPPMPVSRRGSGISNNGNELPLPRRGSGISNNGNELPLPRRGSNISNNGGNDSWTVSPGAGIAPMVSPSTSPKMSPHLMGMLMSDTSPGGSALRTKSHRKKTPGSLKKSTSMGGIRNSPSMNGIRNSFANFKKMRGIKENEKILGIPNLAN